MKLFMFKAFLVAAVVLGFFYIGSVSGPWFRSAQAKMFPPAEFEVGNYHEWYEATGQPVVIFTTTTCPYCTKSRRYLDSLGVSFHDYQVDISEDSRKKFDEIHGRGVPVLLIGNRKIVGHNEHAIKDALLQLKQDAQ